MTDEAARLRRLLGKYTEHVGDNEGSDFLDGISKHLTHGECLEIIVMDEEYRASIGLSPYRIVTGRKWIKAPIKGY